MLFSKDRAGGPRGGTARDQLGKKRFVPARLYSMVFASKFMRPVPARNATESYDASEPGAGSVTVDDHALLADATPR